MSETHQLILNLIFVFVIALIVLAFLVPLVVDNSEPPYGDMEAIITKIVVPPLGAWAMVSLYVAIDDRIQGRKRKSKES